MLPQGPLGHQADRSRSRRRNRRPRSTGPKSARRRAESVDEPPARQHREGVEEQERRVDQAPSSPDSTPYTLDDPVGACHRHADAVEVPGRHDQQQERHILEQLRPAGGHGQLRDISDGLRQRQDPPASLSDRQVFSTLNITAKERLNKGRGFVAQPATRRVRSAARFHRACRMVYGASCPARVELPGCGTTSRLARQSASTASAVP